MNQEALGREFETQRIPFRSQPIVNIFYKLKPLNKEHHPDFVCYKEIIVEIKAISELKGLEEAQIINYLKATGLKIEFIHEESVAEFYISPQDPQINTLRLGETKERADFTGHKAGSENGSQSWGIELY